MRKVVLSILFMVLTVSIHAQQIIQTVSTDDELQLRYELPLQKPASSYAMVVTPLLCGATDTLALEPVVIRGAQNARKLHRDYVLHHRGEEPDYIQASRMPTTVVRNANVSLAAYPWVGQEQLTLAAKVEREGCCEVQTLALVPSAPFRYEAPAKPLIVEEPMPAPKPAPVIDDPVLEHVSQYRPYDKTRVLRKEKGMLYVYFPLRGTEIDADYRNNADVLKHILDVTRQMMADKSHQVKIIQIVGMSSVEGADAYNAKLATARAEALKQYIQQELNVPDNLFEVASAGAAWAEFRDQVNDEDFEGKEQVLRIIDQTTDPGRRQWLIRRLQGGKPYQYIKEHLLPDTRNAGYIRVYWDYLSE